jgi:alpha-ketoglutarate-dependent 2,4-dichlorophenoxyacetate dioxygenase
MICKPLHPLFVAEVSDIDLTQPLDAASVRQVVDAMDRYGVCVYRATGLTDETHIAFSRRLGDLEHAPRLFGNKMLRFNHSELFDAGNLDAAGNILIDERRRLYNRGNALWHTDSSFNPHRSAYSLLLAHETPPEGGDTQFADMRAAYDALPDSMKQRLEGLVAEHWLWHSRRLAGYPEPTQAERDELIEFATQPQFVFTLKWHGPGDLVIWDNRCTMHRATPFEDTRYRRDMRRTTVLEALA